MVFKRIAPRVELVEVAVLISLTAMSRAAESVINGVGEENVGIFTPMGGMIF